DQCGVVFHGPNRLSLGLSAPVPLQSDGDGVTADFTLQEGRNAVFMLRVQPPDHHTDSCPTVYEAEQVFRQTVAYWHGWLKRCTYHGRWREIVQRSALALKLLTYQPTGAIVAAPTASLPEEIGGVRNWDYRFTWIRDASFTVYAFLRLGFTEEAVGFRS